MIIGLDYWQVISHYPEYFNMLSWMLIIHGHEVHVISAVGKTHQHGSVKEAVDRHIGLYTAVHAVEFEHPSESPELKLAKCQELGVEVFYDDRDDVCRLLNKHGILAMRVSRKDNSTYDLAVDEEDKRILKDQEESNQRILNSEPPDMENPPNERIKDEGDSDE